jgi:hypothetical protein
MEGFSSVGGWDLSSAAAAVDDDGAGVGVVVVEGWGSWVLWMRLQYLELRLG